MSNEPAAFASTAGPSTTAADNEDTTMTTASQLAERQKKNRSMFNRKRGDLLDDLLTNLELLIYAQLTIIYYKDCSFFRFLVRAFPQLMFLGPRSPIFPEPTITRPYLGRIVGTNIICMIMHAVGSAPSAGEETRGYLHGGLAMDFIGEKGPTSRITLLLLDLVVLALQLTYMTTHLLRQRLKERLPSRTTLRAGAASSSAPAAPSPSADQSLEDEEMGVRRSAEVERSDDIEMQDLNRANVNTGDVQDADEDASASTSDAILAATSIQPRSDSYLFDAFYSGQIVVADLDLWHSIKEQLWSYHKSLSQPPNLEADRAAGERWASQVLRWRLAPRGDTRVV